MDQCGIETELEMLAEKFPDKAFNWTSVVLKLREHDNDVGPRTQPFNWTSVVLKLRIILFGDGRFGSFNWTSVVLKLLPSPSPWARGGRAFNWTSVVLKQHPGVHGRAVSATLLIGPVWY